MKKYKITKIAHPDNPKLFRIRALVDIPVFSVTAGDLGGFVESEHNLSHKEDCWVSGNAQVFGDARVFGDAFVYGKAQVFGRAQVLARAYVYGNAQVYGNARVFGDASVSENAQVFENALVLGNACVTAKAHKNMQITKGIWDEAAYLEWFFTHERQTA